MNTSHDGVALGNAQTENADSDEIIKLVFGFMASQAVSVAARLGIADHLLDGPKTAEALAAAVQAHPGAVYRMMRALSGLGVFREEPTGTFALGRTGKYLCKSAPNEIGGFSAFFCAQWHWPIWSELFYSVKTGMPAFEKTLGEPFFDYLDRHPVQARSFNAGMTSFSGHTCDAIVAAYDFSGISTLMDVGGGHGLLLCSILKKYPGLRGTLFESSSVIDGAHPVIDGYGLSDRLALVSGNFFDRIDAKADAIMMKHIIHDWDDERSLKILRNCRAALPENGKLLIVEMVIPEPNQASIGHLLDLQMLVFMNSHERTEAQYDDLFRQCGFKLAHVHPTASPFSIIEAICV